MDIEPNEKTDYTNFSFSRPAIYRIEVLGEVTADWSERLQRMQITIERKEGLKPVSTLIGRMSDQAALSGVLNTLYGMHLPVISVKMID